MKKYKIETIDFAKQYSIISCNIFYYINNSKYIATGVARCNSEDIFNEIKGKRIAESRAKIKMFSKILDFINNELGKETFLVYTFEERKYYFTKVIPQMSFEYLKYYKCLKKEKRHLKKLIFN